ncbi:hypothetical protein BP5796_04915 [Coleophoma crateriformis]|uniref:Uncharacterized protein n=1 Tax=Coleophoma crateriformis TaxID=565419 RepID=A0A3D8SBE1_9HELO|nr:hypothetical protein BP5796_04915 [Coleophoma crateriformis]
MTTQNNLINDTSVLMASLAGNFSNAANEIIKFTKAIELTTRRIPLQSVCHSDAHCKKRHSVGRKYNCEVDTKCSSYNIQSLNLNREELIYDLEPGSTMQITETNCSSGADCKLSPKSPFNIWCETQSICYSTILPGTIYDPHGIYNTSQLNTTKLEGLRTRSASTSFQKSLLNSPKELVETVMDVDPVVNDTTVNFDVHSRGSLLFFQPSIGLERQTTLFHTVTLKFVDHNNQPMNATSLFDLSAKLYLTSSGILKEATNTTLPGVSRESPTSPSYYPLSFEMPGTFSHNSTYKLHLTAPKASPAHPSATDALSVMKLILYVLRFSIALWIIIFFLSLYLHMKHRRRAQNSAHGSAVRIQDVDTHGIGAGPGAMHRGWGVRGAIRAGMHSDMARGGGWEMQRLEAGDRDGVAGVRDEERTALMCE